MFGQSDRVQEQLQDLHTGLVELNLTLGKLGPMIVQALGERVDENALSQRVTELEARIELRLGEAKAELLEATEKLRLAKNHEQRARHHAGKTPEGSGEISEEDLEELANAIRAELRGSDANGSGGGGLPPVRPELAETFSEDEYDAW